jgi:hypothetical protein
MTNSNELSSILLRYLDNHKACITTFEEKNEGRFFIKVECTKETQPYCDKFKYDYEKFIFKKKFYTHNDIIDYLKSINENREERYTVSNLKGLLNNNPFRPNTQLLKISNENLFYGQKDDNFNIKTEKPLKIIYYNIDLNNYPLNDSEPLINEKNPFFPNILFAFRNIMGLDINEIPNGILFLIPLHQNYFKKIELSKNLLKIQLNNNSAEEKIGLYYHNENSCFPKIVNYNSELKLKFDPTHLEIFLLDNDYQVIDIRKWHLNISNNQFGINYKYSEEEIEKLLLKSENSDHERKDYPTYKTIKDKQQDLMETIVAFANCKGGNILFGVKNSFREISEIDGFLDQTDIEELNKNIRNLIRSHCIPSIPFVLTKNVYKEKNILILEIPEGKVKPYVWRYNNKDKVFIRNGEQDVECNREELIRLCRNKDDQSNIEY